MRALCLILLAILVSPVQALSPPPPDTGRADARGDGDVPGRRRAGPPLEWLARGEPPVIQAVLYRDTIGLEQAVAAGADINTPGNEVPGVLHADLLARAYEARAGVAPQPLMWPRLRQLGALPQAVPPRQQSILDLSLALGLQAIAEDLLQTGGLGAGLEEPLKRRTNRDALRDRLLGAYLRGGHFQGADRLVQWLLHEGQHGWAYRILGAASAAEPLDRQPDPDHAARAVIVGDLIREGQLSRALRLFKGLPRDVVQGSSMEIRSIGDMLGLVCDVRRADAFVAAGLALNWMGTYMDCLSDTRHGSAARLRVLRDIDARGGVTPDDWDWVFGWKELAWLKNTQPYRRHRAAEERLQGYAGILIDMTARHFAIRDFTPDSPAREAGLRVGDVVTAVNGVEVEPLTWGQATRLIRGKPGTAVQLSFVRDGEHQTRTVVRRRMAGDPPPSLPAGKTDSAPSPAPDSGNDPIVMQIWNLSNERGAHAQRAALLAKYLQAGQFRQADNLVRSYLARNELGPALAVLKASGASVPFDRQQKPAHYVRLEIVERLIGMGQWVWAKKVFAALPEDEKASPPHAGAIVRRFARACDFRRADAFQALGLRLSWTSDFGDCLSDRRHPASARTAHLQAIVARGGMEPESRDWLLRDADKAWLKSTAAYRMQMQTRGENAIERF